MNDEIERLEGSISTLSTEIDHYRGSGAMSAQAQLTTAKAVADTLSRTEGLQTTYGRRYEAALKTVELLKDSIMEIFNKVRARCLERSARQGCELTFSCTILCLPAFWPLSAHPPRHPWLPR